MRMKTYILLSGLATRDEADEFGGGGVMCGDCCLIKCLSLSAEIAAGDGPIGCPPPKCKGLFRLKFAG